MSLKEVQRLPVLSEVVAGRIKAAHAAVASWFRSTAREGWPPEGARRWAFDSGSTRSATAWPREAGAMARLQAYLALQGRVHSTPPEIRQHLVDRGSDVVASSLEAAGYPLY